MAYSQVDENRFEPTSIPIQIHPLPSNHMRISLFPSKVGTYRIYVAYRNLPINGKWSLWLFIFNSAINENDEC